MRDLSDISEEASSIHLTRDVSEICKSRLFEMSLRRWMIRIRDGSENIHVGLIMICNKVIQS